VPRLLVRLLRDSGSISGRNKRRLSSAERKRRSGPNKISYSKDSGGIPPVIKRKGHKSDRSPSSTSEVKHWWSATSHFMKCTGRVLLSCLPMLLCAVGVCPTQFIIVEMVSEPACVVCLPASYDSLLTVWSPV